MSQHVLPTWQTGLSSRVPTPSLPAVEVHVRLSVCPSVHVCCGCSSLPHSCWAWPQAVPRPRGCEQTWPSSGSHCARLPFCHHSTSASRNGTRAKTCRPAAAPRREPLTAQPGGCWLRSSQQKPAHPPQPRVGSRGPAEHRRRGVPDCGSPGKALWVAKMSRGGQEPTRGRRVGLGRSRACCSSWVLVSCGSGQRRLPPWPPVSPLS